MKTTIFKTNKKAIPIFTRIVLGIFLFTFAFLGACLFSPLSLQATKHMAEQEIVHEDIGSTDHIFAPIHPEGEFFVMHISPDFRSNFLLISIFFVLALTYGATGDRMGDIWHRFRRRRELHERHSPHLLLFQDGIVHPKIF